MWMWMCKGRAAGMGRFVRNSGADKSGMCSGREWKKEGDGGRRWGNGGKRLVEEKWRYSHMRGFQAILEVGTSGLLLLLLLMRPALCRLS